MANEIQQQIQFFRSKLNWDIDASFLTDGDSKYFLNTVPSASEHAGVRTNCLGTTEKTSYISIASPTSRTVTTTYPTTSTIRLEFTLASVPGCLWVEILFRGQLKHIFILGYGYTTVSDFITYVIAEIRKHFANNIYSYGTVSGGCYFIFERTADDTISMLVKTCSTASYPTTLTVIGAHYDHVQDVTYYWTYDTSVSKRSLFQYVNYNGIIFEMPITLTEVAKYSRVTNAFVIGTGRDAMLYWLYKDKTAHKINIYDCMTAAISFSDESTNITKRAPFKTVSPTQTVSTTYKNYDQYFQLLVRNKFRDGERSVFGSYSGLIYPSSFSENTVGLHGGTSSKKYDFAITDDSHNEFSDFEYAIKVNESEWKLVELKASTTAGYTKEVTGSDVIASVADTDITRLFDYVPQQVGSMHQLNNNRVALAKCTEGRANVVPTATLSTVNPGYSFLPSIDAYYYEDLAGTSTFDMVSPSATTFASHVIYFKTVTDEYYVYLPDDTGMTATQVAVFLKDYINTYIAPVDGAITSAANVAAQLTITASADCSITRYIILKAQPKDRSFPSGTNFFGIVYYDKFGRCGGVNICDEFSHPVTNGQELSHITVSLSSTPPEWAYYYRIFYGGSDKQQYQQYLLKSSDVSVGETETKIYIHNCVIDGQIINSAFSLGAYVFNSGDRIRFLQYNKTTTSGSYKYTEGVNFTTEIDCEILSSDEAAIYIPNIKDSTVLSEMAASSYYLVEIYTPKQNVPIDYYETPHWGLINNPGTSTRAHAYFAGARVDYTLQNQSGVTPMVATMSGFDHVIRQTFYFEEGVPVTFWIISESFSNYFPSKNKGLGRVNFYIASADQLTRNIVRASNVYLPNTDINGLSTFEYANEAVVDETYGQITEVKTVGDVFKIIQPHKISSMYLGAEVGADANGNQVLFTSDKILTTPRYNSLRYGSMHPESIVIHSGYMYALDVVNSVVWRDTPGGTFAISDNGMRSYFKVKIQQLVDSCGYSFKAYGGYDYTNDLYLLTFKDPYNSANNETIGFHEPSESWYSFYSFLPELYCGIPGDDIISFYGGKLYEHTNATRNTFYGTTYDSNVWVVGNINPDVAKKWTSLVVNSNDYWTAAGDADIIVDPDSIAYTDPRNYTVHNGEMQSALKEYNFRYYNGDFIASFLRDSTTSSSTFSTWDLINGRQLMGKTILIKLANDNTSPVYLKGVKINAQIAR